MDELERNEYEIREEELKISLGRALNKISELENREIDYETKLAEKDTETKAARKRSDIFAAQTAKSGEDSGAVARALAISTSASVQLKASQVMTEALNSELVTALDRIRETLSKYIPEGRQKEAREELEAVRKYIEEARKPTPDRQPEAPKAHQRPANVPSKQGK